MLGGRVAYTPPELPVDTSPRYEQSRRRIFVLVAVGRFRGSCLGPSRHFRSDEVPYVCPCIFDKSLWITVVSDSLLLAIATYLLTI